MITNRHTLYGFGALLLWSMMVALTRSLSEKLGPLTAATAVHLLGGVFCMGLLAMPGRRERPMRAPSSWKYLAGCGFLFALYSLALFVGVGRVGDRTQVLEIGLVNYLWPTLTILLSLVLLRRHARVWLVPATFLALAGVFLVLTQGADISWSGFAGHVGRAPLAYGLGLVAAVSWGLYSNLARRWAGGSDAGGVYFFIPLTGVALLVLRLFRPEASTWNAAVVGELVLMSAANTAAYLLWDSSMRKGDVVLVTSCSYFTPLLSTLFSCLYLGVSAGSRIWIGCALIIAGSLLSWRSIKEKEP